MLEYSETTHTHTHTHTHTRAPRANAVSLQAKASRKSSAKNSNVTLGNLAAQELFAIFLRDPERLQQFEFRLLMMPYQLTFLHPEQSNKNLKLLEAITCPDGPPNYQT